MAGRKRRTKTAAASVASAERSVLRVPRKAIRLSKEDENGTDTIDQNGDESRSSVEDSEYFAPNKKSKIENQRKTSAKETKSKAAVKKGRSNGKAKDNPPVIAKSEYFSPQKDEKKPGTVQKLLRDESEDDEEEFNSPIEPDDDDDDDDVELWEPTPGTSKSDHGSSESDDESDWEEVEDGEMPEEDCDEEDLDNNYHPEIPQEGVEITVDVSHLNKGKKKKVDVEAIIRQKVNRAKKELQREMHQSHLLCLLARGLYLNSIIMDEEIRAISLSLIPSPFFAGKSKALSLKILTDFITYFNDTFKLTFRREGSEPDLLCDLKNCLCSATAPNVTLFILAFIAMLRNLRPSLQVRLCYVLNPLPLKPPDLVLSDKQREIREKSKKAKKSPLKSTKTEEKVTAERKLRPSLKGKIIASIDLNDDDSLESGNPTPPKRKTRKLPEDDEDWTEEMQKSSTSKKSPSNSKKGDKKKPSGTKTRSSKGKSSSPPEPPVPKNRKIISSDSEESIIVDTDLGSIKINLWAEVYLEGEKRWICCDVMHKIIDEPHEIEKLLQINPPLYIISIDQDEHVKDITQRYASNWTDRQYRLRRIGDEWWFDSLKPFRRDKSKRKMEKDEDFHLQALHALKPLPQTLGAYIKHPLYVLQRHLRKYEAFYPPDCNPVGFFKGEPVYSRDNLTTLHTRQTWVRHAKTVKPGEKPYKMSKHKKKYDRATRTWITDVPLELFGEWQTEPYIPPVAKNGIVPRNEYGNVELFKECMLPIGTVHLKLPGLIRIAKKLNIDVAEAVVGFDGNAAGAGSHPVIEGVVVCQEFAETLVAAWEEEQENMRKRQEERKWLRIKKNWRRLVKGVLIRERLRKKYGNNDDDDEDTEIEELEDESDVQAIN